MCCGSTLPTVLKWPSPSFYTLNTPGYWLQMENHDECLDTRAWWQSRSKIDAPRYIESVEARICWADGYNAAVEAYNKELD